MRSIEWILVCAVLIELLVAGQPARRRGPWLLVFVWAALGLSIAAVVSVGFRWQLTPVYVMSALPLLAVPGAFRREPTITSNTWAALRIGMVMLAVLVVAVSAGLGWALPVPDMPAPTGPYAVGTATYHLIDASRAEARTDDPGDRREIMLQVWYPASSTEGERARLIDDAAAFAEGSRLKVKNSIPLMDIIVSHLDDIRTHSYVEAPAVEGQVFPLVLHSHGWTGFRTASIDQIENLASHGFIVAAPDHTYGALATSFPDGRGVAYDPAIIPSRAEVGDEAYFEAIQSLVDMYAADLEFTLETLKDPLGPMENAPFAGRIDFGAIGVFGHSTGGAAAAGQPGPVRRAARRAAGQTPAADPP